MPFQSLVAFEPTRRTLHAVSKVIGVVPRRYAPPHPQWWHISLRVVPSGLIASPISLPDGCSVTLLLDLVDHLVAIEVNGRRQQSFALADGLSANGFAALLFPVLADLGLPQDYPTEKYADDQPGAYDPTQAKRFFTTLRAVDEIFKEHRQTLTGDCGPVQLWPHGFDLAFEWFGTRTVEYEEEGETQQYTSQLNLGFFPGGPDGEAYFYSNPFPFEAEALLSQALPDGATWHTDGWQGAYLPYATLVDSTDAPARLREFAVCVYELARPTLLA